MFRRTFAFLFIFALSPLIILTVAYYFYHAAVISKEYDSGLIARMKNADYLVTEIITDKVNDVISWSHMSIPEVCFEYNRPEAMVVFLDGLKKNNKLFSHIIAYQNDTLFFSSDSAFDTDPKEFAIGKRNESNATSGIRYVLGKYYIVITSSVHNNIGDVVGYLSAFIQWDNLEELIFKSGTVASSQSNISVDELFYNEDIVPMNEASKLLTNREFVEKALENVNKVSTYKVKSKEYRLACIANTNVLSDGKLIQCAMLKSEQYLATLKFVRNLVIIIASVFLIAIIIMSFVITENILSPFKKIVSVLETYKKRVVDFQTIIKEKDMKKDVDSIVDDIVKLIKDLVKSEDKIRESAHLAAIGKSTAMVAHDVRKPLASMKALLTALPSVKDNPVELDRMTLAVDNSIRHTNTMLNDILEFSRDSTALNLDKHNPQSIITSALSEVFRVHPNSDVKVSYNLQHRNYLHVDGDRVIRVLVNIIDNALDAMTKEGNGASGKLWIETISPSTSPPPIKGGGITIMIGNDGPQIPDSALEKLFDPFFTQGKKGGTGLGLSICQKIIQMHGGKIEARSKEALRHISGQAEKQRKTEFIIELPAAEGNLEVNEAELINHSSELKIFHEEEKKRSSCCDVTTLAEFMRINKERGRISYMLLVDDEPLFRETVRAMLYNLEQVKDHIKVIEADSAEAALELFKTPFDYVITDIDLGKMRMNGYEFAQIVMEKYPETYVLIHSNKRRDELDVQIRTTVHDRASPARSPSSREAGGRDTLHASHFMGFLPKPMTQSELLQFLACKTFEVENKQKEARDKKQEARKTKRVLVINDDENLVLSMKFTLRSYGAQVLTASNVSEALTHLAGSDVDIILSDINLGENEPSGYDMLKNVREKDKKIPFYFMSGYSRSEEWPRAEKLGANGYFQLPIEMEELKKVL